MSSNRQQVARWARWAPVLMVMGCGEPPSSEPDAIDDRRPPSDPLVTVTTALGGDECGADCLDGYHTFPDRYAARAVSIDGEALTQQLRDLFARPEAELTSLAPAALRERIVEGLGTGFLYEGLRDRPLSATLYRVEPEDRYERRFYRLEDDAVGAFDVRVLVPHQGGPWPVVLALHGHGEGGPVMEERFLGRELAEHGYAVVLPQFRAMRCSSRLEGEISIALLKSGFTLMGLQVYEAILAQRFADAVEELDTTRVGVLSHSGGSSTANLLVHLVPWFAAQVTDYLVDWRNRCPTTSIGAHCETIPALFDYGPQIANDPPLPRLAVPYGFADDQLRTDIIAFFDRHLHRP